MFDYKRIDFGKIANKAMEPIAPKFGASKPTKDDTHHPNTGVVKNNESMPHLVLEPPVVAVVSKENVNVLQLK